MEMAGVMSQSIQIDDGFLAREEEIRSRLVTENKVRNCTKDVGGLSTNLKFLKIIAYVTQMFHPECLCRVSGTCLKYLVKAAPSPIRWSDPRRSRGAAKLTTLPKSQSFPLRLAIPGIYPLVPFLR